MKRKKHTKYYMEKEKIKKEDGRYLIYYHFHPVFKSGKKKSFQQDKSADPKSPEDR
ncbi:MAG: hypothetical protein J7M18_08735 [Candidatus Eremiobacteraeota bacterium]|nr:hypothetical protein [Candidatus Eremiobacteraeota bacterium]